MYAFDKIKLVVWDLDETFWQGTISEGEVHVPELSRRLLERLTDVGIVNSICSKNDREVAERRLEQEGLRQYFVFLSVNWEPKGQRLKQLIEDMQLRPANVLFLDDNPSNLEEAKYYCPDLMTAGPGELPRLMSEAEACTKLDKTHKRLQQYRLLEEKHQERTNFGSNEEFLYDSQIHIQVGRNCGEAAERIHDLVWRTNQLNFTKKRSSLEELQALFADPAVQSGYVRVRDRFGDYGITGFFALRDGELIHFCFSCRILGMGVEQYLYHMLGKPQLRIVGEVTGRLEGDAPPGWIHLDSEGVGPPEPAPAPPRPARKAQVLIKGPCDLYQIMPYLKGEEAMDTELSYVNDQGIEIASAGHTTQMVEACRLTQDQKELVCREVPFADMGMYSDAMYRGGYKLVIVSMLTDANIGVYRRKETGERVCLLEGYHPLTDPDNWPGYLAGQYDGAEIPFTRQMLEEFSRQYEFVGINTPGQVAENIRWIRAHLDPGCLLAVMLGGELEWKKNTSPAYRNRHLLHKEINDALRALAAQTEGIHLIDVNRYLVDQRSFYDHFNHYVKPVYYQLAEEISELIRQQTGQSVPLAPKAKMALVYLKNTGGRIKRRLLRRNRENGGSGPSCGPRGGSC